MVIVLTRLTGGIKAEPPAGWVWEGEMNRHERMREKLGGFYEAGILPVSKKGKRWINPLLLAVTLVTTTLAGAILAGVNPIREPALLYQGLPFSLSLMAILGAHELGHFLVARHRGVEVSWPYFIPAPPPPLTLWGTFGAFIKIKSALPDRRALLDIGIAGPLAGLALTIPAIVIGLHLSEVREAGWRKSLSAP